MQNDSLEHEDGQTHTHYGEMGSDGSKALPIAVTETNFAEIDKDLGFEEPDNDENGVDDTLSPWDYLLQDKRARVFLARMKRVLVVAAEHPNTKMAVVCFLIATGDDSIGWTSITQTAKQHGVSKAAVSRVCVNWCKFLGKNPSAYMRSAASKKSFQLANRRNIKIQRKTT